MRHYHRWLSFPLIPLLFCVTLTGLYLQFAEVITATAPTPSKAKATLPGGSVVARDVVTALSAARAARPDLPAQKIEITYAGSEPRVRISTMERLGPSVEVDINTGRITYEARPKRTLRTLFILIHSGKYFGLAGTVVMLLCGLTLLGLCLTGIAVYIDMFNRRRRVGKPKLFWK